MLRVWGKVMKNNKIIKDDVVTSDIEGSYEEKLKECIIKLCEKFDISKPYWLQANLNEYNRRGKTAFNQNNFIDEIDFDKLMIEELDLDKK